ncbi:E3 SUMO-protein ligase ZBED1-like [Phymastichus coffea]|uniref:E3 SUMO-protein ligase ZBED1-like n=1 Tax=Phymastichus coffea TaxID=108790 RepID=UPI00273B89A8|nr:E3 SUMO-protein ligase ZBED1-like [Phymastichus coffea]
MEKSKVMQIVKLKNHSPTFHDVWRKFNDITKNIAFSMVLDLFPITPLEMKTLQNAIRLAEPFYQFPSETQLLEIIIPRIYNQVKQKVLNTIKSDLLKGVKSVALTIDGWNGRSIADYMSVTIHYWTEEYECRHLLLQLESLPRTWNTAQDLFHLIENVLLKYGLSEERTESVHIVTANGNNIVKAISMSDKWIRIPCFARLFQQTVDDVLRSFPHLDELVTKCRYLLAAIWTKSATDVEFHKSKLHSSCILDDIVPSWNSIFDIFDSLLKLRSTLQIFLEEADLPAKGLAEADWETIESYVQMFSLLKQASVLFSEEAYPPLSLYLPTIRGILELMESMNLNNQLSVQLIRSICSRFGHINTNQSMIIAMVLDPRFKTRLLAEDEQFAVFDMVKGKMLSVDRDERQATRGDTDRIEHFADQSLKTYFTKIETKKAADDTDGRLAEAELTYYLCQNVVPMNTAINQWWKGNCRHFPKLAKLARIYLSVPAVQVCSERAFPNKRGFIVDSRAELLTSQVNVLDLMRISFLNSNLGQFRDDVDL